MKKHRIPSDMEKGNKWGLLTLNGNCTSDKNKARVYEAVCDCGVIVHRYAREIRNTGYCYKKNHPELRKTKDNNKKKLESLREELIGETIREFLVIDVYIEIVPQVVIVKCTKCGAVHRRHLKQFLNGESRGCPRIHEEEIERRRIKHLEEKEKRKQDRIKKNKGVSYFKDLTGNRYGKLVVTKRVGYELDKKGNPHSTFKCKCDCGGTWVGKGDLLTAGSRKYCDNEVSEMNRQKAIRVNLKKKKDRKDNSTSKAFRRSNYSKFKLNSYLVYLKYQGVCQKCRKIHPKTKCHAHHLIPVCKKQTLAFVLSNNILLCEDCHLDFHKTYGFIDFDPKDIISFISGKQLGG